MIGTSAFQKTPDCHLLEALTVGAGSDEQDGLSSGDRSESSSLQPDDMPEESPAAQQLDAQLADEKGGSVSDASEASEGFMQAEAVQFSSPDIDAANEGEDEEVVGDALGMAPGDMAPGDSSGAAVQDAQTDEAQLYPGDTC